MTAATVDADKLQIIEDEQTVKEDRQALDQTRLRAPVNGTITSLESITPGDSVSSGSTSNGDSSSSSTSTTGSTALGSSTASTSSSSSSSSSSFAVIDSLKHLSMTVSFTEADINKLKVGQPAVVTLDALSNLELAGKVTSVSSIGTTSDDVTSYDATVTLNQYDSRVKPGMSASAEVVIKQGHGVTVPSGAVTGSGNLATVTEDVNGKHTTEKVIVGIRGDSRDLIVSGLSSGAELVETETLPVPGLERQHVEQLEQRDRCLVPAQHAGRRVQRWVPQRRVQWGARRRRISVIPETGDPFSAARPRVIEVRDVHKRYAVGDIAVHALRGVSMTVGRGEYVAIMGASGSGKSTLMHILGCLDVPTSRQLPARRDRRLARSTRTTSPTCATARSGSCSRAST